MLRAMGVGLIIILNSLLTNPLWSQSSPKPIQGQLDLTQWNAQDDAVISLSGDWRYLPELSREPWHDFARSTPIKLPDYSIIDAPPGSSQNASYLLKVKVNPSGPKDLVLFVQNIVGSFRIRLCPQSGAACLNAGGSGIVSEQQEQIVWSGAESPVLIPENLLQDEYFLIAIDSSSFLRSKGFTFAPILGPAAALDKDRKSNWLLQALLLGAFGMIALNAGSLFFQSRRSLADLFVALMALCFMGRYCISEWIQFTWLPVNNLAYSISYYCLFYFSTLALSCFALFLHALYGTRFLRILSCVCVCVNILYISTQSVFEASYYMSHVNTFWVLVNFLLLLVLTGSVGWLYFKKEQDAGYVLLSISILMVAAINDYLSGVLKTHDVYLFHYGVFCFAFCQSLITGRRFDRTHRQNEKLLVEISEKEEARTLFFHNTSHELRTPLNGLIGFLTLLRDDRFGRISDQVRDQVGKCLRLSESLKNQVNTILDLAKAKKGMLNLNNSVISLPELVDEMRELSEGLLLKKADSRFNVQEEWAETQPDFIGDKEKIATIIRNLLGNAFKFADARRPNHVSLLIQKSDKQLLIEVRDTGIGIPADQQSLIFEEFKQVSGDARRAYEGSGLGLSMVRDLVRLMGGLLEVDSQIDQGSTFTVRIPEQSKHNIASVKPETLSPARTEGNRKEDPRLAKTTVHTSADNVSATARILVVDDNEINCEVIQHMLEEKSYGVESALSGRRALETLKSKSFDLILLDMMMPEMSGEDVILALRSDPALRDIPVILITARASDSDRIFGLSLGADDYLAKPLHADELSFRVKNLLERLDLQRKGFILEEQERMAQLGELLNDMSHELKNIFQFSDATNKLDNATLQQIVRRLPLHDANWDKAVEFLITSRNVVSGQVETKLLAFPNDQLAQDSTLRSLRLRISFLNLSLEEKQQLWQRILALSTDEQMACEQTLALVRSFALMRDQTRFAQEMIFHILNFNHVDPEVKSCRLKTVADSIQSIIAPKLSIMKIDFIQNLPDVELSINVIPLRQILLNFVSNSTLALNKLPPGERWMRWEGRIEGKNLQLRLSNAGPKIPSEIADHIFSRIGKDSRSEGFGLGLSISRRLILRAGGALILDQSQDSPCLLLTIPLLSDQVKLPEAG